MDTGDLALHGLLAGGLLVYGVGHGALVVWVWRKRERAMVPTLLFISPIGMSVGVLAATPLVGLTHGLIVLAAMALGFLPVGIIVGWALLHDEGGLQ